MKKILLELHLDKCGTSGVLSFRDEVLGNDIDCYITKEGALVLHEYIVKTDTMITTPITLKEFIKKVKRSVKKAQKFRAERSHRKNTNGE